MKLTHERIALRLIRLAQKAVRMTNSCYGSEADSLLATAMHSYREASEALARGEKAQSKETD